MLAGTVLAPQSLSSKFAVLDPTVDLSQIRPLLADAWVMPGRKLKGRFQWFLNSHVIVTIVFVQTKFIFELFCCPLFQEILKKFSNRFAISPLFKLLGLFGLH